MLHRTTNFFYTIRRLTFGQIFYRLIKGFNFFCKIKNNYKIFFFESQFPQKNLLNSSKTFDSFEFLSTKVYFCDLKNQNSLPALWVYNLNYFDFINQKNHFHVSKIPEKFILDWIGDKEASYILNDPYPVSLRIVNLTKWCSRHKIINSEINDYIYQQTNILFNSIEWDLLANHLFANAKALIFAGIYFDSPISKQWLKKGQQILIRELKEQIFKDGGHYENSPMYHSIILEDIIDLHFLINQSKKSDLTYLILGLENLIPKMLRWLDLMSFEENKVSFFNDSALGIAKDFKELKNYAKLSEIDLDSIVKSKSNSHALYHFESSGFFVMNNQNAKLIFNSCDPSPSYNPGHYHAGLFSLEFEIFGNKVISNTGISTYEDNEVRHYERSTEAHNTVVINEKNSAEVWKSFRLARAPFVNNRKMREGKNYQFVYASYHQFNDDSKFLRHSRSILLTNDALTVKDVVNPNFNSAKAIFILSPNAKVKSHEDGLEIFNADKAIFLESKHNIEILDTYIAPTFGKILKTKKIIIKFSQSNKIKLSW